MRVGAYGWIRRERTKTANLNDSNFQEIAINFTKTNDLGTHGGRVFFKIYFGFLIFFLCSHNDCVSARVREIPKKKFKNR